MMASDKNREAGSLTKTWEILSPLVYYYLVYNVAFILILFVINAVMNSAIGISAENWNENTGTISGLAGGAAKVIGVLPLIPMLKSQFYRNRTLAQGKKVTSVSYLITCVMAISASVSLNIIMILSGMLESSEAYRQTAEVQYGVPFIAGLFLYGIVSPLTEEIVFRGLIYNKMKKYYKIPLAAVVSALLFGAWHGNLIQALYGTCMGILLAYVYERFNDFKFPCLFHAVANVSIYTITCSAGLYDITVRWYNAAVLLALCVFMIAGIEKRA